LYSVFKRVKLDL